MEKRDRNQEMILLVVGIAIMMLGAWVLLERVAGPVLEPVRVALDVMRRVSFPLILIAGGVLLILVATRRDLFVRPDGRRLYRSRTQRAVSGVLGGVAEYFGWDVAIVRIVYVIVAFITGFGPLILAYIIASIAIPEAPPAGTVIPPQWPTSGVAPPSPTPPYPPSYPPQPPTSPSVPEIPPPSGPVPPGEVYPPQATAPPAPPAAPAPPPAEDPSAREPGPDGPTTPPTNA